MKLWQKNGSDDNDDDDDGEADDDDDDDDNDDVVVNINKRNKSSAGAIGNCFRGHWATHCYARFHSDGREL